MATDWRALKRELFSSPPKRRTSPTFTHSKLWETTPVDQKQPQPRRIRETNTTKSSLFTNKTAYTEKTPKKVPVKEVPPPQNLTLKSPKQQKSDELYNCEIGTQVIEGMKIYPNTESKKQNGDAYIDRRLNRVGSQSRRIQDNNSNIFFEGNYSPKPFNPFISKKSRKSQDDMLEIKPFNKEEIELIKRQNMNFSDLNGQELGSREKVNKSKFREASNNVNWIDVDSVKNKKEYEVYYQSKQPTTRNKITEQQSVMDTHRYQGQKLRKSERILNKLDKDRSNQNLLRERGSSNKKRDQMMQDLQKKQK